MAKVVDKDKMMQDTLAAIQKIKSDVLTFTKTLENLSSNVEDIVSGLENIDESMDRYIDVQSLIDQESREMKVSLFKKLFKELYPDLFDDPNEIVRRFMAQKSKKKKKKK